MPDLSPILKTKMYRPPVTDDMVWRSDLLSRLDSYKDLPLTLVSAPAGYGKSVIISQWIQENDLKYAWISLDDEHNNFHSFLGYLIAAIRMTYQDTWQLVDSYLAGSTLPPNKDLAYEFINELDSIDDQYYIVLDDYHVIKNSEVHDFINTILQYPPQNVHFVIITRLDPPLRINNLRAYSRIQELRVTDLGFTKEEIYKLFFENLKIELKPETIDHLYNKTEGWAVGLRLAHLYANDADDVNSALLKVKGNLRLIANYLVEEALSKLDAGALRILLSTGVLDRFNAEIIEVINQEDQKDNFDGAAFIRKIERANLFLIPLDHNREWYRLHHLFKDLIFKQLKNQLSSEKIAEIHVRAAQWFESKQLISEALEHYMAGNKPEACITAIEKRGYKLFDTIGLQQTKYWLEKLPNELIDKSPEALLLNAWIAYGSLRIDLIPPIIEKIDSLLAVEEATPEISAPLDFFKGNLSYWTGDTALSIKLLKRALNHKKDIPTYLKGNIELILYMARQRTGECEELLKENNDKLKGIKPEEGPLLVYIHAIICFVHLLCGRPKLSLNSIQNMSKSAIKYNDQYLKVWSSYLEGIANMELLKFSDAFKALSFTLNNRYNLDIRAVLDAFAALAFIHVQQGGIEESGNIQKRMAAYVDQLGDANSMSIFQSSKSRITLSYGDKKSAFQWAKEFNDPPTFEGIFFWIEVPWITKAKVLLHEGSVESVNIAKELLLELKEITESSHLKFHQLEISLLLAVIHEKQGNMAKADELMAQVLNESKVQKILRPLAESYNLIATILERIKGNAVEVSFIDHIKDLAFTAKAKRESSDATLSSKGTVLSLTSSAQKLSSRELEVLGFVGEGYRNKEIARELFVAEVTIKKHLYNIFKKLDVNNRINLVQKAKDLELI
jgi:LuxR family maltose regulon positive regulatory protein